MRPITSIEEIRKIEFNLLRYVHYICEKYQLTYYLAGGTLLGAVRHQGYIPWDDDVDLLMPRKDYEKFIQIINHQDSPFQVLTYKNDLEYLMSFGRLVDKRTYLEFFNEKPCKNMGVFVDLFPMDGVDGPLDYYEKHVRTVGMLRGNRNLGVPGLVYAKILCFLMDHKAKKTDFASGSQVACKTVGMGQREIMDREQMEERILLEFEGGKFFAPVGYDVYLRNLYHDYMKLPPQNQRRRGHTFCAWYRQ